MKDFFYNYLRSMRLYYGFVTGTTTLFGCLASGRPLADAAKYTRSVPDAYIAKNGHDVTSAFIAYARPLVGPLPHSELL